MFAPFFLVLLKAAICQCEAEFQMFPGFEVKPPTFIPNDDIVTEETTETTPLINYYQPSSSTTPTFTTTATSTISTITFPNFECPEEEQPLSIGSYEVPSQRDLVLLIRKTLIKKFQSYNRKALFLLKSMNEASKAATQFSNKCFGQKYRACVNKVKQHCSVVTKKLMAAVEEHKQNITYFTEGKLCNMAEMEIDPIELLKLMAAEEVTLTFALPAFLRLINDCRPYCRKYVGLSTANKPIRRITDQAFLVKHILSNNVKDFNINLK